MAVRTLSLWSVLVILVSSLVSGAGAFILAANVDKTSNQRWCSLMSTLDDAYKSNPPATETGRRVAAQIHELRFDFGC